MVDLFSNARIPSHALADKLLFPFRNIQEAIWDEKTTRI